MISLKQLTLLTFTLSFYSLFGQLSYTTQLTNNTNCDCNYTGPKVLINQFCATPSYGNASIYGNDGQTPLDPNMWEGEWIELYNPSPCSSSDISNYIIGTTINNNALSFLIPSGTIIPPRGFAVIRGHKSPIPPADVVDILVNNNNNICSANPDDYFWLPGEGGLGGWFCLYSNVGVPLDAVEYGPQWPFNTTPPCNPPGNTLPAGTVLAALTQIRLMPIFKDFHPGAIPPNFTSLGRTYFRTPDGEVWNNAESPDDLQPENTSFGSCNISSNCLPPSFGCNGSITINMTSGTAPYTYNWNTTPSQNTPTITGLCAGEYCVTVTDATGLSETICTTIVDELFDLNTTVQHTTCNQNNGTIELNPEGTGPFTYTWTPNVSTVNSANLLPSGTYHILINNGSCERDTTIVINPSIGVSTTLNSTEISCITNQGTAEVIPTGGVLPYTISWNNVPSPALITTQAGNTYISCVTDANGCTAYDTITPIAPIIPTTSASYQAPICIGDSLFLFASNSTTETISYSWSGPNDFTSNMQNPIISNVNLAQSGMYYITTFLDGCTSKDSVDVIINSTPEAFFSVDTTKGCVPLTIAFTDLSNPVNSNLQWIFGDSTASNSPTSVSHTYTSTGDFDITLITTLNNCSDTMTMVDLIHVSPYAQASFLVDRPTAEVYDPSFVFTNTSTDANSYIWNFGDSSIDYSHHTSHVYDPVPGFYNVTLIANNPDNCADTNMLTIQIVEPLIFYIPNTFTPDDDIHNQTFQPVFTSGFDTDSYKISIYNRWGEVVFESSNFNEGWNGTYKGERVQDGVYTWSLTFKDKNNDKMYRFNGHVNVLQ